MVFTFISRCVIAGCLSQLVVSAAAAAQITTGNGEVASVLYLDANVALAGATNGGLYRSPDQGLNWSRIATVPLCSVKALAKATSLQVFAATDCGLYMSTDGGNAWKVTSNQPSSAVAVTPAATPTVLIGVPGLGILRSTNAGLTFSDASGGLDSTDVRAISFDPSNSSIAYAALFNPDWYPASLTSAQPLGGVFKSIDGGVTWSSINQPPGGTALTTRWVTGVAVNSTGAVFATTAPPLDASQGTVQKYSSGAWSGPSTTSPSEAGIYGAQIVTIDANGTDVWIGSNSLGPYVWLQSNNQLRRQMDGSFTSDGTVLNKVNAISTFSGASTLLGVAGVGVYRSNTVSPATGIRGYSTWTVPAADVQADRALSFVRNPVSGDSFIALAGGGVTKASGTSTVYSAFNAGFPHPSGVTTVAATPSVQNLAVTGTGDVFIAATDRGVMRSPSGTAAWSGLTTSAWQATGLAAVPGANDVFAAEFSALKSNSGVYRISASGSASNVQRGWQSGSGIGSIALSQAGYSQVYALAADSAGIGSGTNASGYIVPTTPGVAPTLMVANHVGFQRLGFYAAADSGSTVIAASLKGLFRSTDGGATFTRVTTTGLPSSGLVGLTMQAGIFFAATRKGDLLCSTDVGSTWQSKLTTNSRAVGLTKDGASLMMLTDGEGIFTGTAVCP